MAQTGFTPLSLYYTTTAAAAPSAVNLVNGELAINITDGKLYYKDNLGVVKVIAGAGGAGVAGGSNTQVQYNSSGNLAGSANMVFDGTTLTVNGLSTTGTVTLGDASGDALTINSSAVSIPNGLNFDSNTFVIDATNNNIGIGTATPTGVGSNYRNLVLLGNNGSNIDLNDSSSTVRATISTDNSGGNALFVDTRTSHPIVFRTTSGTLERMRIASNGNVGIGTNNPSHVLDVSVGSGSPTIRLLRTSTTGADLRFISAPVADGAIVGTYSDSPLLFVSNSSERMRITSAGNVGIGTSSPTAPLHVAVASGASTAARQFLQASGSAAAATFMRITNTGGDGVFGVADASGTAIIPGGTAYATQIYTVNSTPLQFGTNSSVKATLDSSGNLGLGVTPSAWATVKGLQVGYGSIYGYSALDMGIQQNAYYNAGWKYVSTGAAAQLQIANSEFRFNTAASGTAGNAITFTQAMTLDASGRLLIGGTSSVSGAANGSLDIQNTADAQLSISRFSNGTGAPTFYINKSRGTTVGTNTIVANADDLGNILFRGADGTNYIQGAKISAHVDGTPGTNDMPARLVFATTADGASSPTERMRIDSTGNALFAKAVRATITTDNDLSFDMNAASNFKSTLSAGGALTFTNITSGQTGNIILVNGSNYAITAAATTKVSATCLATISATGTYWLSYYSDGTNVYVANTGALA